MADAYRRLLQDESYILLIAGAIAFPIGIIHGFLVWIGVA